MIVLMKTERQGQFGERRASGVEADIGLLNIC